MRRLIVLGLAISMTGWAGSLQLIPVIKGGLKAPVGLVFEPGRSDLFYIIEQKGRILKWQKGQFDKTPFLDIQNRVTFGGERGLLGLAFHPLFKSNGRFFINYTAERPQLTTFISEFQTGVLKEKVLLQIEQPFSNHNGGHLAFDKEGYLYIGTGDGGSAGDPLNHSQNLNSLLGKMLRIGVDSKGLYDIPKDNPLTSPQQRKEIFAWGLRNPWRFSFDRETGALFAGDVGQDRYEEIDLVEKGKNYGWRVMEADHCLTPPRGCNREGYVMPLTEYGRSEGGSVTGGYVYRGKQLPDLKGVYIYGDFMSGNIWGLSYDQASRKVLQNRLLLKSKLSVASFAEDADGELYVVDYSGVIYRLAPGL